MNPMRQKLRRFKYNSLASLKVTEVEIQLCIIYENSTNTIHLAHQTRTHNNQYNYIEFKHYSKKVFTKNNNNAK